MKNATITAEEALQKLNDHPLTKKLQAEEAAETLRKREAAAARIGKLRKEQAEAMPPLQKALAKAEADHQKALADLKIAEAAYRESKLRQLQGSWRFENEIKSLSAELRETADASINEAIEHFQKQLEFLRSPGRIREIKVGAIRNLFSWTKKASVRTNESAVLSCLSFCQAAIAELQAMKLSPSPDGAKIEELKRAIPSIDQWSDIEAELHMPKDPEDVPIALSLPTEGQTAYEILKLKEKAQKLLKRKH